MHPSVERRDLHPRDRYLRDHTFEIVSRPKHGPNLWGIGRDIHGNALLIVTEAEAHRVCHEWEGRCQQDGVSVFDVAWERKAMREEACNEVHSPVPLLQRPQRDTPG